MIIRVERSGGFAGISEYREMNSDDLPSSLKAMLPKLVNNTGPSMSSKRLPKGAADHYSYRIMIQDGANQRVIECNEHDIQNDLKDLVRYVEHNSNKRD